ncbi:MAG: 6-phosphofructokinase [Chloroflexia bacterium]|nr:6-phosphofructokinase [Chloroflexia bacterium]
MRRLGVLTSGGDGPGMNPAIRAVVRTALEHEIIPWGIQRGFQGLIDNDMQEMTARSVGGIIQRGGTLLGTARSPEFMTERGRMEALRNLNKNSINALIVIGGDGSMRGALELHKQGFPVVGVPGSIDNDVYGSEMSIGVDTALNTLLQAVDRIKDTASSHRRAFLIEAMGRNCGYLALMGGLAGGAEMVLIPEVPFELEEVLNGLRDAYIKGKAHCIIIVAEGASHRATEIKEFLDTHKQETGFTTRVTILGHVQRGGSPSAFDRILGSRLGAAAVQALIEGQQGIMVGISKSQAAYTPLEEVVSKGKPLDMNLYRIARILEK